MKMIYLVSLLVLVTLTSISVSFNKDSNNDTKDLTITKEFKKIKKLAEQGDPAAQNKVGWMYDQGIVVDESPTKAIEWYLKSANQGFLQAQINLGVMHEVGRGTPKDAQKANMWYLRAENYINKAE